MTDKNREALRYINFELERWWACDGHHLAIIHEATEAVVHVEPADVLYAVAAPATKDLPVHAALDGTKLTIDARDVPATTDVKTPNIDRTLKDFATAESKAAVCFDPTLLAKALPLFGNRAKLYIFDQGLRIEADGVSYVLMAQRE